LAFISNGDEHQLPTTVDHWLGSFEGRLEGDFNGKSFGAGKSEPITSENRQPCQTSPLPHLRTVDLAPVLRNRSP
jgi:hypothetical protein